MAIDKNLSVLIVDDFKTMLSIIRHLLNQLGFYNVKEATSGSMALEMLRRDDFGLIISDWNMGPMTGLQLLREVRADEKLRTIPFIMVTAELRSESVIAAKEAGVSNYVVKPFDAETLRARMLSVLGELPAGS